MFFRIKPHTRTITSVNNDIPDFQLGKDSSEVLWEVMASLRFVQVLRRIFRWLTGLWSDGYSIVNGSL